METEYLTNILIRTLDMIGMVIAPIFITLPIFKMTIQNYQIARSTNTSYNDVIVEFLVVLLVFLCFSYVFGKGLKHYVYNQAAMDEVRAMRILYSGLILGGFIVYLIV